MRQSRPTLSFFILVALAAVASYGALVLTTQLGNQLDQQTTLPQVHQADVEARPGMVLRGSGRNQRGP